jgi:uncharacterized protein YndB with AHSA1/START domain
MPVFLTIRLTPYLNGTMVELLVHGFERFGDRAAERHLGLESGWSVHQLRWLRDIVEA